MLQSKAGYIDARPLTASSTKPLATHGRTIHSGQTRKSGDAITTSALPPTADIPESGCDVRKVPCVDGSGLARAFFTVLQHWSVQPCVRPFDAVHMTAGHNALRGSGPDQHLAFK